jgi:hypothetical protein
VCHQLSCRLYDTREKHLIQSFVDDVMDLVELQPNKEALVRTHSTVSSHIDRCCTGARELAQAVPWCLGGCYIERMLH